MKKCTVLLLAGGQSKRFWPFQNKVLTQFFGKSFIDYQIEMIKKAGFSDIIVIASNSLAPQLQSGDITVEVQHGTGQAAAILTAAQYLNDSSVLVVHGSDLVEESLFSEIHQKIELNPLVNLVVGYQTDRYFPGGYLVTEGKRVKKIIEKPTPGEEPSQLVRVACDYFSDSEQLLSYVKSAQSKTDDVYEVAINQLISDGNNCEYIPYSGNWFTLKYPWNILDITEHFLKSISESHIHPSAKISEKASISGNVIISEGVVIHDFAKLVGPLFIGPNTIIGNNTLVRASIINNDSVIGFNCDVTRSYIGSNVWLHSNYIGDSVIGNHVTMGAATTMANLRLDEGEINSKVNEIKKNTGKVKLGAMIGDNTRIGVGTYIMPGIKIGTSCLIGAGVLLDHDLPDATTCYVKQEHVLSTASTVVQTSARDSFRKKLQ